MENRDDDNYDNMYGNDFETNRKYLTFSWWLLHRGPSGKVAGVIDVDGRMSGWGAPGVIHDLFPIFLAKKRMEPVLRLADDLLHG